MADVETPQRRWIRWAFLTIFLLGGVGLLLMEKNRWRPLAPMPSVLFESAATVVDGKIYVFGGFYDHDIHLDDPVYVYDPQRDSWEERGRMPVAVSHLNAVPVGHDIWFAGGFLGDHPGAATNRQLIPSTPSKAEAEPTH